MKVQPWFAAWLGAFVWPLLLASTCLGAGGLNTTLPLPFPGSGQPQLSPNDLVLNLNTMWPDGYGYRPIQLKFATTKPANVDRVITIRLNFHDANARGPSLITPSAEREVIMPAGATELKTQFVAPKYNAWIGIRVEVWVDGVADDTLTTPFNSIAAYSPIVEGMRVLIVEGNDPTRIAFAKKIDEGVYADPWAGDFVIDKITAPIPEDALALSVMDVVVIDVAELASLEEVERASLQRWVRLGGALWVVQVGDDFERLEEIEQELAIDAGPGFEPPDWKSASGPSRELDHWRWVTLESKGDDDRNEMLRNLASQFNPFRDPKSLSNARTSEGWFAEATFGMGKVVAFTSDWSDNRGGLKPPAFNKLQAFGERWEKRTWKNRHGLQPDVPNPNFASWLVPGLGGAPVNVFRVLITLFVLVAGPVSYWLLRRHDRTQLMALTVPIAAALLTAGLFAYAFLADGLGTTVRARSLTLLDQKTGEKATWARLTYYAGLTPREGLSFPKTTAVYPVRGSDLNFMGRGNARDTQQRTFEWTDDAQLFTGGWLPARQMTQFFTTDAAESDLRINVRPSSDSQPLRARNRLGVDVSLLAVVDESGAWWLAKEVAEDGEVELKSLPRVDALLELRLQLLENAPAPPEGYVERRDSPLFRERNSLETDPGIVSLDGNLMNAYLRQLTGLSGDGDSQLRPRSYVAVTSEAVGVALGLDDVTESGSTHVIVGRW